ncbi:hypothetical protein BH10PLA2_BH10PLA2_36780 [soil metagenome]
MSVITVLKAKCIDKKMGGQKNETLIFSSLLF